VRIGCEVERLAGGRAVINRRLLRLFVGGDWFDDVAVPS
jgi:hypothetical protein